MIQSRTKAEVWNSILLDLISIQIEGKIVFINTAGAKMLGAAFPGQLLGKSLLDFVHPDYREIAAEQARLVMTEAIVIGPSKEVWLRLDGKAIHVEVAAMPLLYEGKRAVQLIACASEEYKSLRPAQSLHPASRSRLRRRGWRAA